MTKRGSILSTQEYLPRTLSLWSVVLFGLAFMALTTVFSTFGIASELSMGMITGAYIVALIVMLFTAYSYGIMARRYPVAGSAYSYVQRAISPSSGFLVGWAIMMDYLFIPMVNFMLFGIFFHDAFPMVPQWLFIVALIVLVTGINLIGIKLALTVNLVIVVASILFAVIFSLLAIYTIVGGQTGQALFSLEPIINFNEEKPWKYIIAGASLLCFSFLGFDAVTTFSEEVKNPQKVIPRAIFTATLIGGILFIIVSYVAHQAWPNYKLFADLDSAAADVIRLVGGNALHATFLTIFALSILGSAISAQASGARILFAMGRDGQLPKRFFGHLHPKYKTPVFNIFLIGVISLLAIVLSLGLIASFINFGAFIAFIMVNVAVLFLYFKEKKQGIRHFVALCLIPLIGALLDIWLFINLDSYSLLLGSIWFGVGIVYLCFLTGGFKNRVPIMDSLILVEEP